MGDRKLSLLNKFSFLQTYIGDVSLSMGWAWLEVISVGLSLTSLVVTGVWYNREPGPGARLLSAITLTPILPRPRRPRLSFTAPTLSSSLRAVPLPSPLLLSRPGDPRRLPPGPP